MAPGGRLGGVRESLGPEARPMTIEINGMAHVILTVSQFEIARAFASPMPSTSRRYL